MAKNLTSLRKQDPLVAQHKHAAEVLTEFKMAHLRAKELLPHLLTFAPSRSLGEKIRTVVDPMERALKVFYDHDLRLHYCFETLESHEVQRLMSNCLPLAKAVFELTERQVDHAPSEDAMRLILPKFAETLAAFILSGERYAQS